MSVRHAVVTDGLSLRRRRRWLAALTVALVTSVGPACGDGSTGPAFGFLQVSIQTSGGDQDVDGYLLVVDTAPPRFVSSVAAPLQADGSRRLSVVLDSISPGPHSVSLQGVAANCSVSDTNPRSVAVLSNSSASVAFAVACVATGVTITTHTTGVDLPFAYDLQLDKSTSSVATNSTQTVTRLAPGDHVISLRARTGNCTVATPDQTVTLALGTIATVQFEISCVPVTRAEVIAFAFDTLISGTRVSMIGTIRPDGSGRTLITAGDLPAWSADGTRLVYSTTSCGTFDAYYGTQCTGGLIMMDPETGNVRTPIDGAGGFAASWAPAGDLIAFTRCCVYADRTRLYLARTSGSAATVQLYVPMEAHNPAWSPDGRRIAFICVGPNMTDVCVINADGTGFAQLTTNGASDGEGRPAWSHDGKSIAFTNSSPVAGRSVILSITLATGAITPLIDGAEPSWSRDASSLVVSDPSGLYIVSADGSKRTPLLTGGGRAPAWRP